MWIAALAYVAGIAVAAPPAGPLTMLFYRHAMVREFRAAAALAIVIALADGLYAAISTYGSGLLLQAPSSVVLAVRLTGVALLALLGIRYAFFTPRVEVRLEGVGRRRRVVPVAAQGMGIAFLNPSALVSWIVLVDVLRTTFGFSTQLSTFEKVALPMGVAAGVATWFAFVLVAWRAFVRPPSPRFARNVIRVVGVVLLVTATVYGWQATHPAADPLPGRTSHDSAQHTGHAEPDGRAAHPTGDVRR